MAFDLTVFPEGMQIQEQHGYIWWRPAATQIGTHAVRLRVRDSPRRTTDQSFDVIVAGENPPPIIHSTPNSQTLVGQSYTYAIIASDPNGDSLTYTIDPTAISRGTQIDASGQVTWNPDRQLELSDRGASRGRSGWDRQPNLHARGQQRERSPKV